MKIGVSIRRNIFADYLDGVPTDEICCKYNISEATLSHAIVLEQGRIDRANQRHDNKVVNVLHLYHQGVEIEDIAKANKLIPTEVRKILKEHDLPCDRRKKNAEINKRICAEYKKGKTVQALANEYNFSVCKIYYTLKTNDVQLENRRPKNKIYEMALRTDRTQKGWQNRLAKECGVSRQRVSQIMKKEGLA